MYIMLKYKILGVVFLFFLAVTNVFAASGSYANKKVTFSNVDDTYIVTGDTLRSLELSCCGSTPTIIDTSIVSISTNYSNATHTIKALKAGSTTIKFCNDKGNCKSLNVEVKGAATNSSSGNSKPKKTCYRHPPRRASDSQICTALYMAIAPNMFPIAVHRTLDCIVCLHCKFHESRTMCS